MLGIGSFSSVVKSAEMSSSVMRSLVKRYSSRQPMKASTAKIAMTVCQRFCTII